MVSVTFNGRGHNVPAGHNLGFVWGDDAGGPYPNNPGTSVAGDLSSNQVYSSAAIPGFVINTPYYYKAVIRQGALIIEESPEATFTPRVMTTWNPLDKRNTVLLSNGDLTATVAPAGGTDPTLVRCVHGKTSGKYYIEYRYPVLGAANMQFGLSVANGFVAGAILGHAANPGSGGSSNNGVITGYGGGADGVMTTLLVGSLAVDCDNKRVWWRANGGDWNGDPGNNPATNIGGKDFSAVGASAIYLTANLASASCQCVLNAGALPFTFAPPAGFTAGWPI